jgi:DNA-binding XRE family transcriptional regulator
MSPANERREPRSARDLFGMELRRLRERRSLTQEELASIVPHSRTLIAAVELAQRWPPRDLAVRCDAELHGDGALTRLWPLVEAERQATREILPGVRVSDLRHVVLHLAALTGTDLSALTVAAGADDGPDGGA